MLVLLLLFCAVSFSPVFAADIKVLAVSGSTRSESVNKKLAKEAADLAKSAGASVKFIDLNDFPMPFYDEDLETSRGLPESAVRFRKLMKEANVIIIASPEYNGSLSGILKNTLDWASRNETGGPSRDAFKDKKFVLMSASPGGGGGARGLVHLQSIIENLSGVIVTQNVSIPSAHNAFDAQGHLKDPQQKLLLEKAVQESLK